jgi:hypothetical protein
MRILTYQYLYFTQIVFLKSYNETPDNVCKNPDNVCKNPDNVCENPYNVCENPDNFFIIFYIELSWAKTQIILTTPFFINFF